MKTGGIVAGLILVLSCTVLSAQDQMFYRLTGPASSEITSFIPAGEIDGGEIMILGSEGSSAFSVEIALGLDEPWHDNLAWVDSAMLSNVAEAVDLGYLTNEVIVRAAELYRDAIDATC